MGLDPYTHPPFRADPFTHARRLTDYPSLPNRSGEAALYQHFLGFLQKLSDECSARGLELRDHLDAQSVMWAVVRGTLADSRQHEALERWRAREIGPGEEDEEIDVGDAPSSDELADIDLLADALLIDVHSLRKIVRLIRDKRQAIFHGPPGTGKTYVAMELAGHLTGGGDGVELVQFHPSYAYEDFVEGYRPQITEDGRSGFRLKDGPLKRIAKRAAENPDRTYVLVVDEINRGNVAKVFGELYLLLEYRRKDVSLQYSDEPFSLPPNLLMIGTMNTADRSIALVDAALRRRFHFLPFFPSEAPIDGLLRRWLQRNKPEMMWVADVVDAANRLIEDRHLAIGPSHFLRSDLDSNWVELIWEHSVMPYLAEQFFGNEERLEDFRLPVLRGLEQVLEEETLDNDGA
jgi:MoxR-like ATPase